MAKNPSSVWYWNDARLELTLRQCSMAARGFWHELLAIAAEATPYGHVVINGAAPSTCQLAQITGQRKQDVSRWTRELEKHGVFSRTEDGTIFCRRMVREAEAQREKASHRGKARPPRVAHPQRDTKQPDLLDDPPPKPKKCADSDSDSVAVSQNSPSTSKPLPESLDAPRAREGKSEKHEKGNPEGGRCAPLDRPPPKSPALKAKIRAQLQQKHARYLQARRRPDELAAYWLAMVDPDPMVAQRAFDDTDRRMRCAGWDDMRGWKRENGIVA
jgi:hypothetical protein